MTTLARPRDVYQYGTMARNEALTKAVRSALKAWPGSRRDLAQRAGVPHVTLTKIANDQLGASVDVAGRVLSALEQWRQEQRKAVATIAMAAEPIRQELLRVQETTTNTEE